MSDIPIIAELTRIVGRSFSHEMEDDRCVSLDLTDPATPFSGLVRHHSGPQKESVLQQISRLRHLKSLNLRRNLLRTTPDSLGNLTELETLVIGSNDLREVPFWISKLTRLKYLHLGNNYLSTIPEWMGDFPVLEYLTLHKNLAIKSASLTPIGRLRRLRNLNLYFISLISMPEWIFGLRELRTLSMWNTKSFPGPISELPHLEFLTLCGAIGLRESIPGLAEARSLRMIRLFQNSVATLPDDIGNLDRLEQLTVYQNQLTHLPDSMRQLHKLQKLNLGWNAISSFPDWLTSLPSLKWLGIFQNPGTSGFSGNRPGLEIVRDHPWTTLKS